VIVGETIGEGDKIGETLAERGIGSPHWEKTFSKGVPFSSTWLEKQENEEFPPRHDGDRVIATGHGGCSGCGRGDGQVVEEETARLWPD